MKEKIFYQSLHSALCDVTVFADAKGITQVKLCCYRDENHPNKWTKKCCEELREFFAGERKSFDLPLRYEGTPFACRVWEALLKIPYGSTASYKDIAIAAGAPKACRAVGGANHSNPLPVLIPCHRVIAADGSLGGYAYPIQIKQKLLVLEAENADR